MCERGWGDSECLVEFNMLWCIRKMIFSSDHVGDLHFYIVYYIHEMEDPTSVRTSNSHVRMGKRVRHIKGNPSADHILHHDGGTRRAESKGPPLLIQYTRFLKPAKIALINRIPLALTVWSKATASFRPFIPANP